MIPWILFRKDRDTEEEFHIAREVWEDRVFQYRSQVPPYSVAIGRYSVLPFYKELEDELASKDSRLINSWSAHRFIAEMQWYRFLEDMTPKTWFDSGWANVPDTEHGWVVKGRTNSRKFQWKTHMYAPTREALKEIVHRLYDDPLISDQGLAIREYVPLRTFEVGINGMPVTNEWRCFFYHGELLSAGYYWSQAEDAEKHTEIPAEAKALACKAAAEIQGIPFFVIDVAETEEGPWTVIEVNDGQMSGLSMNDPKTLYQKLWDVTHAEKP